MKKLNKIFSILLTAAIMTSLLITSAIPASAADNAWTELKTPSATDMVMPNNITASGLLTQAADGTLFAYINNGTNRLAKSVDGGKKWTSVAAPAAGVITAIAVSPSEANVVYVAVGVAVYKSVDGGATFALMASVPAAAVNITAMDVAMAGGSYKVVVGAGTGANTEVYFMDEGNFFFSFATIGTPSFKTTHATATTIFDVELSPNFATDRGIVVLARDAADAIVSFNVNGGAWGAAVDPLTGADLGATTAGALALPSDFNIVTAPFFYAGTDGGVFRVVGSPTTSSTLLLPAFTGFANVISLDVVGTLAGANLIAGTTAKVVRTSLDAGLTSKAGLNLTGPVTADVFVALKGDFATSGIAYALVGGLGLAANDESAFNVSNNKGANFAQISLLNSNSAVINSATFAAADTFLVTTNGTGVGDAFKLTATAVGAATVTEGTGTVSVVMSGAGTAVYAAPVWTITFAAIGETATVTALTAGTATWTTGVGAPTAAETYDINGSMTVGATGVAFAMDMNTATSTSLWRYNTNGWQRIQGAAAAGSFAQIQVSPNYATDMGVFYVDATNKIAVSTNNGMTFTAQPSAPVGAITAFKVVDLNNFIAATGANTISVTNNNGIIWTAKTVAGLGTVASFAVSADGAAYMAGSTAGIAISKNAGATWTFTAGPAGATTPASVAFQSTFATTGLVYFTSAAGGLYRYDFTATTPVWEKVDNVFAGPGLYRSVTGADVTSGVGVVVGVGGPQGMIYALDANGSVTRVKCRDNADITGVYSELIAAPTGVTSASAIYISGAAGANKLTIVANGNKIYQYTDTLAVFGTGAAVTSFTTTTAAIKWDAIVGATSYDVKVVVGATSPSNPYTATNAAGVTVTIDQTARTATFTSLTPNTTYAFNVWAVLPVTSFHTNGTRSFSTMPSAPTPPVGLAPAPAAVDVPVKPGFQWAPVAGATSYDLWLDTKADFSTAQKFTSVGSAYAWTATALANNTVYYWQVRAVTGTGTSAWVTSVFTTIAAAPPVVTVTSTTPASTSIVLTVPATETPSYIWIIIGVGGLLTILVIVLIVRTRRVV